MSNINFYLLLLRGTFSLMYKKELDSVQHILRFMLADNLD